MKLIIFLITLAITAAGAVLAGRASDHFLVAMLVTGGWFGLVVLAAAVAARRRRGLLVPVGAAVAVVAVVLTVAVGLPTVIGRSVDETVVTGAPAAAAAGMPGNVERASGRFVGIAHGGRGRAAVVELPDGRRKLTLTGFETSSGPDLRVYLSTRDPARGGLGDVVDLGALKGNRGDQQYDIPAGVDLDRHSVVVIWCRAFSVPFTSAALRAGPAATRATRTTAVRAAAAPRPAGAKVRVIDSRFGRVLADGRGHALYLFTRDRRGPSRCYGACARAWPPLLTRGEPRAGGGARGALLGTTRRRDGSRQVTYRGQPLYYYVGDRRPGQILCQNVFEFGGTWRVVDPDGRGVR